MSQVELQYIMYDTIPYILCGSNDRVENQCYVEAMEVESNHGRIPLHKFRNINPYFHLLTATAISATRPLAEHGHEQTNLRLPS